MIHKHKNKKWVENKSLLESNWPIHFCLMISVGWWSVSKIRTFTFGLVSSTQIKSMGTSGASIGTSCLGSSGSSRGTSCLMTGGVFSFSLSGIWGLEKEEVQQTKKNQHHRYIFWYRNAHQQSFWPEHDTYFTDVCVCVCVPGCSTQDLSF